MLWALAMSHVLGMANSRGLNFRLSKSFRMCMKIFKQKAAAQILASPQQTHHRLQYGAPCV